MPITSSVNSEDIQLSNQVTDFGNDQILMHQVEFSDSENAISHDCNSIKLETNGEMISSRDESENVINYTFIGNGLILIEGSQVDFDDETKDSSHDLGLLNGIDFLVTVKDNDVSNKITEEEEEKEFDEMRSELIEDIDTTTVKEIEISHNFEAKTKEKDQINLETHTMCTSNKNDCEDDHDDESSSEQDLTNLGWLIDLKNLAQWPIDSNKSNRKSSKNTVHTSLVNSIMNDIDDERNAEATVISEKDLSEEKFKKFTIQVKQSQKNYAERERIYKMDPLEKPPFNYAQIIAMAMMDCGRMTLKDICKWIQEHFAYFRYNKNWNNSIRHNLSLHFGFTKIARDKSEKGKGGYWELSMNATKSEKKRVRNRRKCRDDGRVIQQHRTRLPPRRSIQRSPSTISTKLSECSGKNESSPPPASSITTNDSCNLSSASDGSTFICSAKGFSDDTKNMWAEISHTNLIRSLQNSVHHEELEQDLISNVITNDLVIINGTELDHSESETIRCNFDKSNSQSIESYFVDQHLDHDSQKQHVLSANGNVSIESSITTAILNDSSNETFIKSDLDQRTKLLSATIAGAGSTSNVIVEPMPYSLSHMDTVIDIEHEFSNLVNMADPELTVDGFFDYGSW
ncbi:uncharacterized protein LOC116336834 [Contarinia nasturtii]|uniref:uncharacterized protein LOC116336834 n=1 Tax=Contarinia nasturtii TaxID=265458 RepID=UPI0012D4C124|nr:uncharacterized protein LOC116336834 [Contarinia nasturtii]